jgi:hypothetical protein
LIAVKRQPGSTARASELGLIPHRDTCHDAFLRAHPRDAADGAAETRGDELRGEPSALAALVVREPVGLVENDKEVASVTRDLLGAISDRRVGSSHHDCGLDVRDELAGDRRVTAEC